MLTASLDIVLCAICLNAIEPDDQNLCQCGECICERCPSFACACVDDVPSIQEHRACMRVAAMELGGLWAVQVLLGADNLTLSQQARLLLLSCAVPSLRAEMNRLDEIRYGQDYSADERQVPDTLADLEAEES